MERGGGQREASDGEREAVTEKEGRRKNDEQITVTGYLTVCALFSFG